MDRSLHNSTKKIIEKLEQDLVTPDEWATLVSIIEEELELILQILIKKTISGQEKYTDYLKPLLEYNRDEDRLTEILENIFKNITEQAVSTAWFSKLCKEFLTWNSSELVVENFFLFLDQFRQKNSLSYESNLIQELRNLNSPIVQFYLMIFLIQSNLHKYENVEILQHFKSVSEELQLVFIPTLLNLPKTNRIKLCKDILGVNQENIDQMVKISILFLEKEELKELFSNYKKFKDYIKALENERINELLYNEYVKPESVTNEWIQELVLENLREETGPEKIILEASGEFIAEWPKEFRERFLQLIMNGTITLQRLLAKMFSPVWYDEQIILQLLEKKDKELQESLYESLISIYSLITEELQKNVMKILRTEEKDQKYFGLLLALNMQQEEFYKEVKENIQLYNDPTKEALLGGILIGLGMKWNELDDKIKKELLEKAKIMPIKLKRELRKGMEMIFGILDVEGMNFYTDLQSYDLQVAPEDITLE